MGKDLEGICHFLIPAQSFKLSGVSEEIHDSVRIYGVSAEILTPLLQNTGVEVIPLH
jgi:hypothetical protein